MKKYNLIIVGAGVSGTFAAISEENKLKTLIIEKNDVILKKFMISGKGKSNITNTSDTKVFLNNLIEANKFLYPAISRYNSQHILKFLDSLKISYYAKQKNRIHLSDSNSSFRKKVLKILNDKHVDIAYKTEVIDITSNNGLFEIKTRADTYCCQYLIIATGGMSFPMTGSDGFGYQIATKLNHQIKPIYPIGVGLYINDQKLRNLQGISQDNVNVKVFWNNKIKYEETGSLMFTHYGIGGPVIRRISGYISKWLLEHQACDIEISFIDKKDVINELHNKKNLNNCFNQINKNLKKFLLDGISNTDLKNIRKQDFNKIVLNFCNHRFKISKTQDINHAINTGGGVCLSQINPNSYESKLVSNLFFIGEVLDLNPRTNGYNITTCFCTANMCIKYINKNSLIKS